MCISWSVHLKESFFKVAECIYHGVFIARKVFFTVAECIYYGVFIERQVVPKLRFVYFMECSSPGKLFKRCGIYIS